MATAPPQPQPLDYNQILGQSASGIGKVSSAASKANTQGVNLGMSTLADYLSSDGRTLTIDPAEKKRLDDAIKSSNKKLPGAKKTRDGLQTKFDTLTRDLATAEAEGNTKKANRLRKTLGELTPKLEAAKAAVSTFETTIADSTLALRTTGPSITEIYQKADPQTYANITLAGEYASKIGQISPEGQRFLDAAGAGYQARDLGTNQIQAAQVANVGQMDYARLANVADVQGPAGYTADQVRASNIRAAQANSVADVLGARTNAAQMGNVADVQAQQGQAAIMRDIDRISASQIGRVADINSRDISSAQIGAVDNIRARQLAAAQTGVSGLGQNLMQTAQERLALGGNLSAQASRDAIQAARAGMAARGLGTGNSALAAELLNRDRYSQQRFLENAGFAQGVEQADLQRRLSNTQQTNAIAQANQDAALRASMANQASAQARAQEQARLQQQASLANQQAALEAATRNQSTALSLGTTNAQLAQQASLANQQTAFGTSQYNATNQQQMSLANQDAALRASLANQQSQLTTNQFNAANQQAANLQNASFAQQAALANQSAGLQLGQTNAQLLQQANLANQSAELQAQQANQAANARAAEFQQSETLRANLANQQTRLQQTTEQARLQQTSLGASFDAAQQRALADAGYTQQAALANQEDARLTASFNEQNRLTANQQNLQQLGAASNYVDATNRAGMAAATDMANINSTYNPLFRNLGMSQQNFFGTNQLGTAAMGPSIDLAGNVASFNANMQGSMYNTYQNNQTALKAAEITGGATNNAGWMAMLGGAAQGAGALGGGYLSNSNVVSDRREKTDIKKIGKDPLGLNTYEYKYKGNDRKRTGPMAQEVRKVLPEAVEEVEIKGKKRLAIRPTVLGQAYAQAIAANQKIMFPDGYVVGSGKA